MKDTKLFASTKLFKRLIVPLVRGPDKCKLFCRVQQSSAYYLLGATVADGTPCGADTFDTCVNGQCIPAGCDHVLGSGKMLGKSADFGNVFLIARNVRHFFGEMGLCYLALCSETIG
jgi:hypothetical protein